MRPRSLYHSLFNGFGYIRRKKRFHTGKTELITAGKYTFYFIERIPANGGKSIELTTEEFKLLKIFADHQHQFLDRGRLLKEVWEDEGIFAGGNPDVFISRLRKKLVQALSVGVTNVHGKGYRPEVNRIFF